MIFDLLFKWPTGLVGLVAVVLWLGYRWSPTIEVEGSRDPFPRLVVRIRNTSKVAITILGATVYRPSDFAVGWDRELPDEVEAQRRLPARRIEPGAAETFGLFWGDGEIPSVAFRVRWRREGLLPIFVWPFVFWWRSAAQVEDLVRTGRRD